MLVADPEQFAVFFARPEPQLDFRHELVRIERQRIFHVTLRSERRRHRGRQTIAARPARVTLAPRFHHTAHARSVFRALVADQLRAQIFRLRTPGHTVPGETRVRQIVKLLTAKREKTNSVVIRK